VGWEKASSFGFSALGFSVGKNQMCLTERWLFTLTHNVSAAWRSGGLKSTNVQASTKVTKNT
jgi:hypothetical protein